MYRHSIGKCFVFFTYALAIKWKNLNIIYSSFRKTTLRFVSGCYTFIRCLELSLLKNLFICLFTFRWKNQNSPSYSTFVKTCLYVYSISHSHNSEKINFLYIVAFSVKSCISTPRDLFIMILVVGTTND